MHVNAAPIFLRKLQCLCSSKNRIFLFQKPGRSFKGNEEKSIYKSRHHFKEECSHCCDFKSWSWILISRWSTECLTSHHQRRVLAEFHSELGREIKQLRGSHCFPCSNELLCWWWEVTSSTFLPVVTDQAVLPQGFIQTEKLVQFFFGVLLFYYLMHPSFSSVSSLLLKAENWRASALRGLEIRKHTKRFPIWIRFKNLAFFRHSSLFF